MAWITDADVVAWLGGTAVDPDRVAAVTAAANMWAYKRRLQYGYADDAAVAPDDAVREGTVMLAGRLYRNRGVTNGAMAGFPSTGELPDVYTADADIGRLLGVPRAVVV